MTEDQLAQFAPPKRPSALPKIELLFEGHEMFAEIKQESGASFRLPMSRTIYCDPLEMVKICIRDYMDGKVGAEGTPEAQLKHWRFHSIVPKPGLCQYCPEPRPREHFSPQPHFGGTTQVRKLKPEPARTEPKVKTIATDLSLEDLI